eukprot:TRINITY_DN1972_c0_g2_i1.p1 TRINITY_DN1972_c0_g2~~TRINITY_DN1972_c0_g2_i1.p1  ORF type:complete len:184 (-),score=35.76 TRINITY_DN1972_c0_g2_i1:350-901(-)
MGGSCSSFPHKSRRTMRLKPAVNSANSITESITASSSCSHLTRPPPAPPPLQARALHHLLTRPSIVVDDYSSNLMEGLEDVPHRSKRPRAKSFNGRQKRKVEDSQDGRLRASSILVPCYCANIYRFRQRRNAFCIPGSGGLSGVAFDDGSFSDSEIQKILIKSHSELSSTDIDGSSSSSSDSD